MALRIFVACALLAWALPANAQQSVNLQFVNGRVTLRAQNAPVRTILAEWARLGGATIVNGDRVGGAPLTLELTDVPERQALDIVLRSVAGYMLGPRRAGTQGASAFDRIMILPTSVAPRTPPPAAAAAAAQPRPVLPRPVLRQPPQQNDQSESGVVVMDEAAADQTPMMQPPFPPGIPQPGIPQPLIRGQVQGDIAQGGEEVPDEEPGLTVVGTPTNPFGVPAGSSTIPGVPAPKPQPQGQPNQTNRVQ